MRSSDPTPGSGFHRTWPSSEIAVARLLDRLAPMTARKDHGALTPQTIRGLCRRVRAGDDGFVRIAKGIYVDLVEISE